MLILLSAAASFAAAPDSTYLEVRLMYLEDTLLIDGGMSGECFCTGSVPCTGVMYWTANEKSVQVGSIDLEASGVNRQIVFDLRLMDRSYGRFIEGSVIVMNLTDQVGKNYYDISDGRAIPVSSALPGDAPIFIPLGIGPEGRKGVLSVTASPERTGLPTECGPQRIGIISRRLNDPSSRDRHYADRPLAQTGNELGTWFSRTVNGTTALLDYNVVVSFSEDIGSITEPTRCAVEFQRTYSIDSDCIDQADFSPDHRYNSAQSRSVVISPDAILKLVFRPDTPSVLGFDIEDTLIINAGK